MGPRREENFRLRTGKGQDVGEGKQGAMGKVQRHVKKEERETSLQQTMGGFERPFEESELYSLATENQLKFF